LALTGAMFVLNAASTSSPASVSLEKASNPGLSPETRGI
jgi:hypothetical protein